MDVSNVIIQGIEEVKVPKMYKIRQEVEDTTIQNISKKLRNEIACTDFPKNLKKGSKVAIGVGSRGIDRIVEIVKETVQIVKEMGGQPFIIPTMGSHGGATAEGQRKVLEGYGIKEEVIGVPIISSMEVVKLGKTKSGVTVYFDKNAFNSDAIICINRVKVHTEFSGPIESGLMKQMVIGFGKHKGAATVHRYGYKKFAKLIPEVARYVIHNAPIALGIAILENGYNHLSKIKAINPLEIEKEEKKLLQEQKNKKPDIPFKEVDVLIVNEIGKNISGSGMDTNVIGRIKPAFPNIKFIVVLDLSPETYGNATGIGLADITTKKLFEKIDFNCTYTNCITGREDIIYARMPIVLESDEIAIKTALLLVDKDYKNVKMIRIKNTLDITEMDISEGLMDEVEKLGKVQVSTEFIKK